MNSVIARFSFMVDQFYRHGLWPVEIISFLAVAKQQTVDQWRLHEFLDHKAELIIASPMNENCDND